MQRQWLIHQALARQLTAHPDPQWGWHHHQHSLIQSFLWGPSSLEKNCWCFTTQGNCIHVLINLAMGWGCWAHLQQPEKAFQLVKDQKKSPEQPSHEHQLHFRDEALWASVLQQEETTTRSTCFFLPQGKCHCPTPHLHYSNINCI